MAGEKKKIKIDELQHAQKVTRTLYEIANAVNISTSLDALYKAIHDSLKGVMDVTNFFIALVDWDRNRLTFPYHVDSVDNDFGAIDDFDQEKSLTGYVVQKQEPLLLKKEAMKRRAEKGGVWGPIPSVWLGVPLMVRKKVIGVVAVQSYEDPDIFTEKDIDLLVSVSDQIAVAIDRKHALELLERSEYKFAKLFQTTPCWCLMAVVESGEILEANETFFKTAGYSRQEVIGRSGIEFGLYVNPDDRQKAMDEFFTKGRLYDFPIQFRIKNGDVRECLWSAQTFMMDDRLCWVSAILDITARRKAEQEQHRARQLAADQEKHALVGQVAGKMAHDFNNILGAIMGNAELAILDCEDEALKKTLELILGQTIRGKSLTRNLTAFAKNQEPRYQFFQINETMELVVNLLKKDLEGVQLDKEFSMDIPDLMADPGMIEHALVNLLQNAVHALSKTDKPRILIRTFSEGNHICFQITDNGCGIPREHIADIFEPSFTLKGVNDKVGSYSSGIKGTGYGMSNVMRYVDQHRGGVYVESEENVGTTFVIRLPVIQRSLTQLEKKQLKSSDLIVEKRILLVEDESAIADIQKRILTGAPCHHTVDVAVNGVKALEFLAGQTYDLVSLDYRLPGKISGMNVYEAVKQQNPKLPVLFVSGNLEFLESIHDLKEQPHIDYLSKPFGNKEYLEMVNQLLAARILPQPK
jgi:PAS domain S-box-containing protein